MQKDIELYDNPPLPDLADSDPIDQCTVCSRHWRKTCPMTRAADVRYDRKCRRVIGCSAFIVIFRRLMGFVAKVVACAGFCVMISEPLNWPYIIVGAVVFVSGIMVSRTVENQAFRDNPKKKGGKRRETKKGKAGGGQNTA